ncbi:hypothetical protein [Dyadobacter sp. 3J3]|uniref:hypothetical protein n=1 Tax=Dyadobacter sp. 3J3 TaxID=2606600 RepID=UPI00135BECC5|nr:hypothetical protein [Dyadobacter sp. 3J3]
MITYNQTSKNLPQIISGTSIFLGAAKNPFLAPRGVWITGSKLIVADTGQNRIFIWNELPENIFGEPDLVLGQLQTVDTGRNSGGGVNASTLQYPSGIWSDGKVLIIADAWNHRVLIWHTFPIKSGQPADVVIGQPDFNHNLPNVKGIGNNPSDRSLNWPYGVCSDGNKLWIADTGNRRVLYFKQIPVHDFTAADDVIGKDQFTERDYESNDAVWPYSVRISKTGALSVTDTQYYRNLIWKDWKTAFVQKADVIIGQPDLESSGQNQYRSLPESNTMSWTYDSFFYKNGIILADTGNSRLLFFDNIPDTNAAEADNLIGHHTFQITSENANTRNGTDKQLYWPFSICISGNSMAVADTGNHRIILYELK